VPLAIGTSAPSEDTESLTPPDGAAVGALAVAISLGIALQERYTRDNFVKYARSHLTDEYVTISALNLFRFEQSTYMDENQQPREAMLGGSTQRAGVHKLGHSQLLVALNTTLANTN
jgi:hypothetical protein